MLLLDEPLSQLDAASVDQLLDYLEQCRRLWGISIVVAEHRLDKLSQRADTIWYLHPVSYTHLDVYKRQDQLKPAAGDIVWWDYHNWSDAAGQSAVIGCYPQPLVDHPVKILTDQRWMKLAHECQEAIIAQGAGGVEVADLSEQESQLNKPTCPVIVIGLSLIHI